MKINYLIELIKRVFGYGNYNEHLITELNREIMQLDSDDNTYNLDDIIDKIEEEYGKKFLPGYLKQRDRLRSKK